MLNAVKVIREEERKTRRERLTEEARTVQEKTFTSKIPKNSLKFSR